MSEGLVKAFLESKNGWIAIILFVLYIAYKLIINWWDNKKAKTAQESLKSFFEEIRASIKNTAAHFETLARNSKLKERMIDSINYKLGVIHSQYGGELSKEMAAMIIHNVYLNFSNLVADEAYELIHQGKSPNQIKAILKNKINIINDEKIRELNLFVYQKKILITFTSGTIVNTNDVIEIVNNYSNKNGLLREEIKNKALMEANNIINRF